MECNCGAYVPSYMAKCPGCDRILRPDAYEILKARELAALDARLSEYETRLEGMSKSRFSLVDSGPANELIDPSSLYLEDGLLWRDEQDDLLTSIHEDLEELGIDPSISLDALIDKLESQQIGLYLWTSGRRLRSSRYRVQLYELVNHRNRHIVTAEASDAWSAIASAMVAGCFEGKIDVDELAN